VAAAGRLIPWYLERFAPDLVPSDAALGELLADLGNVRAVLAAADPEHSDGAQALAWTVGRALDSRQRLSEALEHLTTSTNRLASRSPGRVGLLTLLADVHLRRGELHLARGCVDEASRLRDDVGPPLWDDAGVERTRGELLVRSGDIDGVRTLVAQARQRPLSPRGRARLANLVGIAALTEGSFDAAEEAFTEELGTYEALGLLAPLASAHGNVAEAALGGGHLRRAAHHQQRCLDLATTLGQPVMVAFSAIVAARLLAGRADETAVALLAGSEVILDRTGVRLYEMDTAEIERVRREATARLGPTGADAATRRGRALDDADLAGQAAAALDLVEQAPDP